MRQFEVLVDNKAGKLADVCEVIAKAGINIRAVSTENKNGKGLIRLVTDNEDLTRDALIKAKMNFKEFEIIPARLMDRPGELAKVARALANLKIDIHSIFLLGKDNGTTEVAFKVSDIKKAKEILR